MTLAQRIELAALDFASAIAGELVRSSLGELADAFGGEVRTCRLCGCTDDHACDGGCTWVAEDLCSACLARAPRPAPRAPRPKGVSSREAAGAIENHGADDAGAEDAPASDAPSPCRRVARARRRGVAMHLSTNESVPRVEAPPPKSAARGTLSFVEKMARSRLSPCEAMSRSNFGTGPRTRPCGMRGTSRVGGRALCTIHAKQALAASTAADDARDRFAMLVHALEPIPCTLCRGAAVLEDERGRSIPCHCTPAGRARANRGRPDDVVRAEIEAA